MLSQLMVLFGFFSLVLVAVYWVNRAVVLFDRLIADGHSAAVFLEFTALSLPSVIALVLPMASFAAAVYVTNRLMVDSELTVVQATGYSPWRLSRPVLMFGLIVAVMMSALTHFLVPASVAQLKEREVEISGSVSARLLREGTFLHPGPGVTFFIREITPEGELRDVYLSDRRRDDREVTYTAERAYVGQADEGPRLVMVSGLAQTLRTDTRTLSTTIFKDFTYDISNLIVQNQNLNLRPRHLPTWDMITRPQEMADMVSVPLARINEELHGRFQQALLGLVAALIGFSTLLTGSFSRFGVGRQIVVAIFLLVVVKLVESAVTDPTRNNAMLWPLVYLPSLVGLVMAGIVLHLAARPFRQPRKAAAAEVSA
ncbi:LPS export ABC transporter permease LptF [Marivita geojedonensis]|uniref:Permease n=1 Tax=Marivita geojedonensis TaxID=1123756 RepID=A0A1X4ND47_9RHOB|nr:LPS export ABC transporter permease LptF [Marivita geojedonensis]OSQ44646.1 permease [Marivita geojedonensis]PRY76415.1 lipopolysaccharide export system permease protein [Marivita geojedonensis]